MKEINPSKCFSKIAYYKHKNIGRLKVEEMEISFKTHDYIYHQAYNNKNIELPY